MAIGVEFGNPGTIRPACMLLKCSISYSSYLLRPVDPGDLSTGRFQSYIDRRGEKGPTKV